MHDRRSWLAWFSALTVAVLAEGCRDELGPARFPTAAVRGVVLRSGEPVPGGWIEFQPADGAVGDIRSARIEPDGRFQVDRVAIGLNVVRLVDLPGLPPAAAAVLTNVAPIHRKITNDSRDPIRIDVVEELIRYQNAKATSSARDSRAEGTEP